MYDFLEVCFGVAETIQVDFYLISKALTVVRFLQGIDRVPRSSFLSSTFSWMSCLSIFLDLFRKLQLHDLSFISLFEEK